MIIVGELNRGEILLAEHENMGFLPLGNSRSFVLGQLETSFGHIGM